MSARAWSSEIRSGLWGARRWWGGRESGRGGPWAPLTPSRDRPVDPRAPTHTTANTATRRANTMTVEERDHLGQVR